MNADHDHPRADAAAIVHQAKAIVLPPALCLFLLALLTVLFELVVGYTVVVDTLRFLEYYGLAEGSLRAAPFTLGFALVFAVHLIVFIGTLNMCRLSRYRFAKVAAIVSLVPVLSPGYLLGIPLGLLALTALRKPGVLDAFRAGSRQGG